MPSNRPLDALVTDFLSAEFAADPSAATTLGMPGYDDQLADLSAAAVARRRAEDAEWLRRFEGLPEGELTADERIDRDLALMTLRGRQCLAARQLERRDPDPYVSAGLDGVFTLFLHKLRPQQELVASAAARLRAVPDVLAAGRENLDAELASPVLLRRAAGQATAGAAYCRDDVPQLAPEGPARRELEAAGAAAAAVYSDFAEHLTTLAETASGGWAVGEEVYDALLREQEGLDFGTRELRERGRAAYAAAESAMRELAGRYRGTDDWRAVLVELDRDAPESPEVMRAGYVDWTQRARDFAYERELVGRPALDHCEVLPAEEFQRAMLAVAFYYPPPALADRTPDGRRAGHFFVPYPPSGAAAGAIRDRLAANSRSLQGTVAVHEAYPGHHWHFAWMDTHGIRPLRRVLMSAFFVEGWALYAEELMREEGFFEGDLPAQLQALGSRLFRATRIVVDTSLHLGEMTVEEATEYLTNAAAVPPDVARAEVVRYCAAPTQASSYLTGALEIRRLRNEWEAAGGGLRDFHDRLTMLGGLPLGLAARALHEVAGDPSRTVGPTPSHA
jgi:uncharacterized protein (DUF885 family)